MVTILVPGYILSFDMAWGPIYPLHLQTSNSYIISLVLNALTIVVPSWIVQKLILLLIFFVSGLGAHRLAALRNNTFQYFAGMLYVFNPFVYTRFVAGHWLVLVGYALLPWAVRYFYIFLQTPSKRRTIQVLISTTLICLTSIHTVGILTLIYLLLLFSINRENLKQILSKGTILLLSLALINSFWLLPLLKGDSNISNFVETFNETEMNAFATNHTVLNSPSISAALLTGFWADDQNRYILPSSQPIWWIGAIGVITFAGTGLIVVIRRKEKLGLILAISGVISLILGIGAASPITAQITTSLSQILPIYSGYREPHKWLMLLALSYSFLGSIGAYKVLEYLRANYNLDSNYTTKIVLLFIPFLFAPTLAFGAAGQLISTEYPSGWYEAKQYLEDEMIQKQTPEENFDIVVLPWHQYLPISFSGRVVANPVKYFFKGNLITSEDPELVGVNPRNTNEIAEYINAEILPVIDNHEIIGEKLSKKSVEYILLLKEIDWTRYNWLNKSDLQIVLDNGNLTLYKTNQ
jgi:hypothetical protein